MLATVGAEFPDSTELVESLVTERALLADRLWPGEALLAAYRAAADRGVTATADTAAGTAAVDAYLEVATAGAYRFFVACDRAGTAVDLRFDHLSTRRCWRPRPRRRGAERERRAGPGHRPPPRLARPRPAAGR